MGPSGQRKKETDPESREIGRIREDLRKKEGSGSGPEKEPLPKY
jgi:hypothetical protein